MVTEKLSIPNFEGLNYLDFLREVNQRYYQLNLDIMIDLADHPKQILAASAKFERIHNPEKLGILRVPSRVEKAIVEKNPAFFGTTLDDPKPPYFTMSHGGRYILGPNAPFQLPLTEENSFELKQLGLLPQKFNLNSEVPMLNPYLSMYEVQRFSDSGSIEKGFIGHMYMYYFYRDRRRDGIGIMPGKIASSVLKWRQPLPDFYLPQEKQA